MVTNDEALLGVRNPCQNIWGFIRNPLQILLNYGNGIWETAG